MMNHLFLYKECGSLLILSFTSSIDKCNTALVILAIALFSRSWFPLFRILPQTASWYQNTAANVAALGSQVQANGSDERLLTLVDAAIGCTPWMAPDLTNA